ncbi:MAG: hypothetical protein PHV08_02305 [Sulfurovaceae bacterium]|nr:hypothetical protein [Sulfurovaceae bacterium]
MFVGWIRPDLKEDIMQLSKEAICDKYLCYHTYKANKSLCFGIYNKEKLVGFISAFAWEKSIIINNFCYTVAIDDETKMRLIRLLLRNIESKQKPVLILANEHEKELFSQVDFQEYTSFYQAVRIENNASFNFSHATAESINGENYLSVANQLDEKAFGEHRPHYMSDIMQRHSSLSLCTQNGYLHSYALGKRYIRIAPWIMKTSAYIDAEKLLRGVLYHRGLKKIIAYVPTVIKEITDLYESYKFEFQKTYHLMYLHRPPILNLEMIYAF